MTCYKSRRAWSPDVHARPSNFSTYFRTVLDFAYTNSNPSAAIRAQRTAATKSPTTLVRGPESLGRSPRPTCQRQTPLCLCAFQVFGTRCLCSPAPPQVEPATPIGAKLSPNPTTTNPLHVSISTHHCPPAHAGHSSPPPMRAADPVQQQQPPIDPRSAVA